MKNTCIFVNHHLLIILNPGPVLLISFEAIQLTFSACAFFAAEKVVIVLLAHALLNCVFKKKKMAN